LRSPRTVIPQATPRHVGEPGEGALTTVPSQYIIWVLMWRAWGIFLLALSPQDLGTRVTAPDHEFALRPPSGWTRHVGTGPTLVKFTQPGELKLPGEFMITHLYTSNPTPIASFKRQAKDNIKE